MFLRPSTKNVNFGHRKKDTRRNRNYKIQVKRALDNDNILKKIKLIASLLELHGENDFKVRSYNTAVFRLDKVSEELNLLSRKELEKLEGVGKSIAAIIDEINQTAESKLLNQMLDRTPPGLLQLLKMGGVGPKKLRVIWEELGIETADELYQAIEDDKISELKGFGKKTQDNILEALLFKLSSQGKLLYAECKPIAESIIADLTSRLPHDLVQITGDYRRKLEIIERLNILVGTDQRPQSYAILDKLIGITWDDSKSGPFVRRGIWDDRELEVEISFSSRDNFYIDLMTKTGSLVHLDAVMDEKSRFELSGKGFASEEDIYRALGIPFIQPELREGVLEGSVKNDSSIQLLESSDLKGILHSHSTYSDGKHSLRDMASYCQSQGYQYLGITDHSKSAVYANGLSAERIAEQHIEIDKINEELSPFKIFRGIESDILTDGSLDYSDDILKTFDFIIISIHSGMKMDEEKATKRLIKAIENPYSTILGHMTGRLLLRRSGYPVNHEKIIDACAQNNVVIEINAHPWRLDIDWRWVHHALEKDVWISINPDAHEKNGIHDMQYGVNVGRKGGLTKEKTLNALTVDEIRGFFEKKKLQTV